MSETTPQICVKYAYSRHQGNSSLGGYHAVLAQPLTSGRLQRKSGDALCRPRNKFWGLDETPNCTQVTCSRCLEIAGRIGIDVP